MNKVQQRLYSGIGSFSISAVNLWGFTYTHETPEVQFHLNTEMNLVNINTRHTLPVALFYKDIRSNLPRDQHDLLVLEINPGLSTAIITDLWANFKSLSVLKQSLPLTSFSFNSRRLYIPSERDSFALGLVACLSPVKVNDAVNPWHTYKLAVEQKAAESLQTDTNGRAVYLYLCWQNLTTQMDLVRKTGYPSRRSQFLGNWSRRSSGQDTQSHPERRRLIVFVLRLFWRRGGSCEFRGQAFPSSEPLLNWLFCRVHLVYRHDRGDLVFPFILLL